MQRYNFLTPISVLTAGLVMIGMLFIGPSVSPNAAVRPLDTVMQAYPPGEETIDNLNQPYPGNSTITPVTGTAETETAEPNETRTTEPDEPEVEPDEPTPEPTRGIAPTSVPNEPTLEPEITITPTPSSELTCVPGQPVDIVGEGPPRSGFLLYFDERVVSGGSIEPDGTFAISIIVGDEQGGTYPVVVRERGTFRDLLELTCIVPVNASSTIGDAPADATTPDDPSNDDIAPTPAPRQTPTPTPDDLTSTPEDPFEDDGMIPEDPFEDDGMIPEDPFEDDGMIPEDPFEDDGTT
ncbi:MAG: hypothetical protein GFH23_1086664n12 [Chloroflexi bacterium AL-N1]|nr:hypothetical protein [Chloroflexi bacterium AL-N1]